MEQPDTLALVVIDTTVKNKQKLNKAYFLRTLLRKNKYLIIENKKIHHQHLKIFTYVRKTRDLVGDSECTD